MEPIVTEVASRTYAAPGRRSWLDAFAGAAPALCCVVLLAQAIHGVTFPIGEHNDSRTILENSVAAILQGHYERSRSLGVPLYEAMAAACVGLGGLLLANLYSLVLAIGSVFLFNHLLGRDLPPTRRILILAAFALNPIFVGNSTMLIEWMQAVFFMLLLLASATAFLRTQSAPSTTSYALASIGCVLTRPDLAWYCGVVLVVLLWETAGDIRKWAKLIGANAVAAVVTIAVFLSLNDVRELATAVTFEDRELSRQLALAVANTVALLGVIGTIAALALLAGVAWRGLRQGIGSAPFETKLLLVGAPIFAARLVMLPTKVEFLFPLLIVFLLAVARQARSVGALTALAVSMVLGSVVQLSLLEHSAEGDTLHVRLELQPGGVAQDWQRRLQNAEMLDPHYLAALAKASYGTAGVEGGAIPALHSRAFFPGLISDANDLVIGRPEIYQLDNPRFDFGPGRLMFAGNGDSHRSAYRHIYVCDKSVAAAGKGWRILQPPPPIAKLDPASGLVDTQCLREAAGQGG
jgi:hypothetical protein